MGSNGEPNHYCTVVAGREGEEGRGEKERDCYDYNEEKMKIVCVCGFAANRWLNRMEWHYLGKMNFAVIYARLQLYFTLNNVIKLTSK